MWWGRKVIIRRPGWKSSRCIIKWTESAMIDDGDGNWKGLQKWFSWDRVSMWFKSVCLRLSGVGCSTRISMVGALSCALIRTVHLASACQTALQEGGCSVISQNLNRFCRSSTQYLRIIKSILLIFILMNVFNSLQQFWTSLILVRWPPRKSNET